MGGRLRKTLRERGGGGVEDEEMRSMIGRRKRKEKWTGVRREEVFGEWSGSGWFGC